MLLVLALAELVGDGVEVDIMSRAVGDCIIASRLQCRNVVQPLLLLRFTRYPSLRVIRVRVR